MAAAAVAVLAGIVAGVRFLIDTGDDLLASDGTGVEVRQVIPFNGPMTAELDGAQLRQTKASTPHLDISVLNSGSDPVLLTKAVVTIVDSAHLALCQYHTGDAVPVSWKYATELPVFPSRSERVVARSLHQEIPAGGVDRFQLFFRLPWNGLDHYVYALRTALLAGDGGKPVAAGGAVVGLPDAILAEGLSLPYGHRRFGVLDRGERLMSTWCARRNMADLRRVLRRPGRRSARMAALAGMQPADWWQSFADRRAPKVAAESLLSRPGFSEAPVLAVFAAERSGDHEFEADVRRRAAAALIGQARRSLQRSEPYAAWAAVVAARQANHFSPSAQGSDLLAEAESRWEVARTEAISRLAN